MCFSGQNTDFAGFCMLGLAPSRRIMPQNSVMGIVCLNIGTEASRCKVLN